MDEQAGPGVFFSNNHPGAGGAKGLGPLAEAAAAGDGAAAAGAARAQYSLPGILHFLQHEWARFEVERAQWEVERAELQVKTLPARPSSSRLFSLFRPAPDSSPPPPAHSRPPPPCLEPITSRISSPLSSSSSHLWLLLTPFPRPCFPLPLLRHLPSRSLFIGCFPSLNSRVPFNCLPCHIMGCPFRFN